MKQYHASGTRTVISVALFLIAGFNCAHGSSLQFWNSDAFYARLSNKLSLQGGAEFRYNKNKSKLFYKHYQSGLQFALSKNTSTFLGFRYILTSNKEKWKATSSPLADLSFRGKLTRSMSFVNRNRLQYLINIPQSKILSIRSNLFLYRNRIELQFIDPNTKPHVFSFLADEVFFRQLNGFDQNRLEVGLKMVHNKSTLLTFAYIYQSIKNFSKEWNYNNIIRFDYLLRF